MSVFRSLNWEAPVSGFKDPDLLLTATTDIKRGPEEMLLLSVLELSILDLQSPCQEHVKDAEWYIFEASETEDVFSFDNICNHFGFSPSAVRAAVKEHPDRIVAMIDHHRRLVRDQVKKRDSMPLSDHWDRNDRR